MTEEEMTAIIERAGAKPATLYSSFPTPAPLALSVLGSLRLAVAKKLDVIRRL